MEEEILDEVQNKTIGQILKEAREEKRITIEQVAEYTAFRPNSLRAVEADDYSVFKSEIYIKGTIRGYANFLGLDGLKLVERYKFEHKNSINPNAVMGKNVPNDNIHKSQVNMSLRYEQGVGTQSNFTLENRTFPVREILIVICIVLLMIGVYFSLPAIFGVSEPSPNNKQEKIVVEEGKAESVGNKFKNAFETITNLLEDEEKHDKVKNDKQTDKNKKTVPAPQKSSYSPKTDTTKGKNNTIGERYDKVVVEMTASGQCWIDVFADGKAIYSGMMDKGRYKIFEANKRLTVKYGNIGVMQVIVNGRPVDMRGQTGMATRYYPK